MDVVDERVAGARAFAASVKGPISQLGGGFMRYRGTRAVGERFGLGRWPLYVAGRAGVLGGVDADVVAAALVFFPTDWVREQWALARGLADPAEVNAAYAEACREWGRDKLAGLDGAGRLAELGERVARAAEPAGKTLFAGWRAVPLPEDPHGRAAQVLQVLRELRGGAHGLAVLANGLTPLEAIVSGPLGAPNAEFFGWPPPYPDPAPLADRRRRAEDATDDLVADPYAVLNEAEREEFAALLTAAAATAFPA